MGLYLQRDCVLAQYIVTALLYHSYFTCMLQSYVAWILNSNTFLAWRAKGDSMHGLIQKFPRKGETLRRYYLGFMTLSLNLWSVLTGHAIRRPGFGRVSASKENGRAAGVIKPRNRYGYRSHSAQEAILSHPAADTWRSNYKSCHAASRPISDYCEVETWCSAR